MADDKLPTSRVRRSAKIGRLAAGQAARQLGTKAANLTRDDEASSRALEKRQVEAAEQIVAALGTMKGAAMKLGQVMSFLDVGLVPEEYREEFQRKLGELRDAAPNVRFDDMRKVIEDDLEEPLSSVFSEFDEEPVAAASIGQVYRATLRDDGRDVAVKVQYPGVNQAVRSDMQNMGLILRLMKSVAPGLDVRAIGEEVRARVFEELDYELEAQNQRAMARIYRNHPFIVIPGVVSSLSRERVIVQEFVEGRGFEEIKVLPQDERDHIAEIVFRFFFGSLYRHRQFSGDPHPGNFMLLEDARVAFLDFGLFKHMSDKAVELELHCQRLFLEDRSQELFDLFVEFGFISRPERFSVEGLMRQLDDTTWWWSHDKTVALDPGIATKIAIEMSDPRSSHFDQMRHETLPSEHLFARRVEMLTLAVLSQLRAHANFHRIAREWLYGDPPSTDLGREEAAFYGKAAA
jgi:predicted unusual protein kinase regulating ubiquinone biosynthesis (AarF/ABC1/UbiB family)